MKKNLIISIIVILVLIIASVLFVILNQEESVDPVLGEPDPIGVQCAQFCETNQKAAFCDVGLMLDDGSRATCGELATNPEYVSYGVNSCAQIDCSVEEVVDQTCISGLGGVWEEPQEGGICSQFGEKVRRELSSSDEPPVAGQICCK